MRRGINVTSFGEYADPRIVVKLARAAEAAGWDGLFYWDHLAFAWGQPSGDPWVTLAGVAASTQRVMLGTAVTPLARRRLQVVGSQLVTLDLLSSGRVVFGAGLGAVPAEFTAFGETGDPRERAAMLDEGLEVLARLLAGETVTHHGRHYTVEGVALAPRQRQRRSASPGPRPCEVRS